MAAKKSNAGKIALNIVLVLLGLYVFARFVLPLLRARAGSAGAGGASAGNPFSNLFPRQGQSGSGGGSPFGASAGPGPGGAGGFGGGSALSNWINGVLKQGWSNAQTIPQVDVGSNLDSYQIPLQQTQNFDVSQLAVPTDFYDPNSVNYTGGDLSGVYGSGDLSTIDYTGADLTGIDPGTYDPGAWNAAGQDQSASSYGT